MSNSAGAFRLRRPTALLAAAAIAMAVLADPAAAQYGGRHDSRIDQDIAAAEMYRDARDDYRRDYVVAAMRTLQRLIERYPDSQAARRARRDLRLLAEEVDRRRRQRTAHSRNSSGAALPPQDLAGEEVDSLSMADARRGREQGRVDTIEPPAPRGSVTLSTGSVAVMSSAVPDLDRARRPLALAPVAHPDISDAGTNAAGRAWSALASPDRYGPPAPVAGPPAPSPLRRGAVAARDDSQRQWQRHFESTGRRRAESPPAPQRSAETASRPAGASYDFLDNTGDRMFFSDGSAGPGRRALEVIREQAAWLAAHPQVLIIVQGHADDSGTDQFNLDIARKRATEVRQRLIEAGVAGERIMIEAFGRRDRIATCGQALCRAQNRRVVIAMAPAMRDNRRKSEIGRRPAPDLDGRSALGASPPRLKRLPRRMDPLTPR